MAESHQLLQDVDFGVDDYVLEEDYVVVGVLVGEVPELGHLDHSELAVRAASLGDQEGLADVTLPVVSVLHILLLDEQGLQNRDVLLLGDYIDLRAVRFHKPGGGADLRADKQ